MRNWLLLNFFLSIFFISGSCSTIGSIPALSTRSHLLNGFLFQRTVSISQKSCSCSTTFSCACCQSVTILLRGVAKMLCVNFTYQETGLSMNVTLGSQAIRQVSIIDYRAFKVCTFLPDCRYSLACVNVMELSKFPRSITICMQFDITSKTQNWVINYNCISVSTIRSDSTGATTSSSSTTNIVLNGSTVMMGMPPTGIPGTGQMPQNPNGMLMPMPGGSTGQPGQNIPPQGMPPGTPGQMPPAGQMPSSGQMPQAGQMPPPGQMPPAGQMPPSGQMPPAGQMPPPGQMPPAGLTKRMVNEGDRIIVSRSIRTISEAYDILSRRKSRLLDFSYGKLKFQRLNELSHEDGSREEAERHSSTEKIEFPDDFHSEEVTPEDRPAIRLNRSRKRRSNSALESTDAPMKMQVILRHRKIRLPKIVSNESTKNFKASVNYRAAVPRSSRIVNENTVSIPMPGLGSGSTSANNAFPLSSNGGSVEFLPPPTQPPQSIPVWPTYGLSVPLPVFVLENVPSEPIPVAPNFVINYDNRTSSFPDRIPPGFGVSSRIGPKSNEEKPVPFSERSVEELETIGPEIRLPPNSKIISTSTTDLGNGMIVFPE